MNNGFKYFICNFFSDETIDSTNTAATSAVFDIGEASRLWIQYTGGTTAGDVHSQLEVSNDALETPASLSHWEVEGSAIGITGADMGITKVTDLGAQKARVVITRQSGTQVLTIRGIAKGI